MKKIAVIVAGGSGQRMQSDVAKQFINIGQKPILMHTIAAFAPLVAQVLLVLPSEQFAFWQALCEKYQFTIPHKLCTGGKTRAASVFNGLQAIEDKQALVAVHDGVRPFVSQKMIIDCFEGAANLGAVSAAVPLKDSLRKLLADQKSQAQVRSDFVLMQTPQCFHLPILLASFEKLQDQAFACTDELSLVEQAGFPVALVQGDYKNIKITTQEDLWIAETFIEKINNPTN